MESLHSKKVTFNGKRLDVSNGFHKNFFIFYFKNVITELFFVEPKRVLISSISSSKEP